MNSVEIPAEVQQLADSLGINVQEIIAGNPQLQAALAQAQAPSQQQAAQAQAGAGAGVAIGGSQVADGVDKVATETPQQVLQRELAVAQQELQQTRQMMQTIQDGRVVGSSGLSGPVQDTTPNLGGIEPGLRWAVRNGLVELEKIADPLIRDLFKNDLGGVI